MTLIVPRQQLFVVETPYEAAPQVVCYVDTLESHIASDRQKLASAAKLSLTAPSAVVTGTTNPEYIAYVNQGDISSGAGSPFVVFVDPAAEPLPAVATWGYRRDFKDLSKHTVLWLPPSQK